MSEQVSTPAPGQPPKPLTDEQLQRIRQWKFNGANSNTVTTMRDDLLATISADRTTITHLENAAQINADHFQVTCERFEATIKGLQDALRGAIDSVQMMQDRALLRFEAKGFVFDEKGGRWEKMAFTLYSDLCQLDGDAAGWADALLPASKPAPMSERDLLEAVLSLCKLYNWRTLHIRPARTEKGWRSPVQGDGKGFPDLLMVKGDRLIVWELKGARGVATDDQMEWLVALAGVADTAIITPQHWHSGDVLKALSGSARPQER